MAKKYAIVERDGPDRITIQEHYALEEGESETFRSGFSRQGLGRPDSCLGVTFEEWEKHAGTTVDFARLVGTGEGMIGGPTKTQIGYAGPDEIWLWLYHGPLRVDHLWAVSAILCKWVECVSG